jgi:hypothetical protein
MISFVLDIIVIELCSNGGFPLKRQVNISLSNQSALSVLFWYYFGIIVVLLWLYHCLSAISS